jgi:hypothetical protein
VKVFNRSCGLHFLIATLPILAAGAIWGSSFSTVWAKPSTTRAFVISKFTYELYFDPNFNKVCPKGWFPGLEQAFLESLAPKERERLMKPESTEERGRRYRTEFAEGPNGEDQCVNPMSFIGDSRYAPALSRAVQSKIGLGMNLDGTVDGRATARTCAHKKFVSPNGEPGIDNQVFRAIGCSRLWRGADKSGGDQLQWEQQYMHDGNFNYVIEISGITDLRNDEVEVRIYSTEDNPVSDAQNNYIPDQTFTVTSNTKWHNFTRGKIVNGVLKTESIPWLRLDHSYPVANGNGMGAVHERVYRDAKFELKFNDDGSISGHMGAYLTPNDLVWAGRGGGKLVGTSSGSACAMEYNAFVELADGYPDPDTGKCTMLSMAYVMEAIPAFLVYPEGVSPVRSPNNLTLTGARR